MKRLLILGAGRVSAPLIRYFLARRDIETTVAAAEQADAARLVETAGRGRVVTADVTDGTVLAQLLGDVDAVVSLLPPPLHPQVARLALDQRVHFISTSYQAPQIRALDEEAAARGVTILSEVGLDPGLDHMSAARLIASIRVAGGTVETFMSCVGGLPAPDSNDNPWGYKFSWNPRGVLVAGRSAARYLANGEIVEIEGNELFAHSWPFESDGRTFEIYPNRDSLVYQQLYGLDGARGIFRGTVRYPGWSRTMAAAAKLGLFDVEPLQWRDDTRYSDVISRLVPRSSAPLIDRVAEFLGVDRDDDVITRFEWAGMLSDRPIDTSHAAPLDLLLARLERLMRYEPGERDMIVLRHDITARFPDGRSEVHESTLTMHGTPWGDSAMAKSVAMPAAVAARLVLEGRIDSPGCSIPVTPEIYRPILSELEEEGIRFDERVTTRWPGPLD